MAQVCTQIQATVKDKVGKLADVTAKIKAAGLNILALCAWREGGEGHLMLVADDSEKACAALGDEVESCDFGEVVCAKLPNKPGALNAAAEKLAQAGIGIDVVYAAAGDAPQAHVVFITTDNAKAAQLL